VTAILFQADRKLKDRKGNPILRPCEYHLQTFSATEQHYPIYDQEFLAIINGLRHWDYLLKGAAHPIIVIMDHTNLQYYRHPHKIGPCIAGYIAEREQYDIQIAYCPGSTNRADAESRRPDYAPDPYNDEPSLQYQNTSLYPQILLPLTFRHKCANQFVSEQYPC
jgi:hypothetical protein